MESTLHQSYPWLHPSNPIITIAPMMNITTAPSVIAAYKARGIGFIGAGFDLNGLEAELAAAKALLLKGDGNLDGETSALSSSTGSGPVNKAHRWRDDGSVLPVGVGFQNWGADLKVALAALCKYPVAAVWFFGPREPGDLSLWAQEIRRISRNRTKIWVQVGSVADALAMTRLGVRPDVLVVQGSDAGGHGLKQSASVLALLPEVLDALAAEGIQVPGLAAGGICDGRGAAAVLALGASGVVMGTRFLASREVRIAKGYQDEILRVRDGGKSTVRSGLYDMLRGIEGWPREYDARGIMNQSYFDALAGMPTEKNRDLYKQEGKTGGDAGWGPQGRMTTYAGAGVGLIRDVKSIGEIIDEVSSDAREILGKTLARFEE